MPGSEQQASSAALPSAGKAGLWLSLFLTILALLSLLSIAQTVANYVGHQRLVRSVSIELAELRLAGEEDARISVSFSVANNSSVDVKLEDLSFQVFVNGDYVGRNDNVPFAPQTLSANSAAQVPFVILVHSAYDRYIQEARSRGQPTWSVRGTAEFVSVSQGRPFQKAIMAQWQE